MADTLRPRPRPSDRSPGFLVAGLLCAAAVLSGGGAGLAQTTTAPGIDVEVYDPVSGANALCVELGSSFWAHVWLRPGEAATSCILGCGPADGGSAHLAAAAVDVAFDPGRLTFEGASNNPDPAHAAVDGLLQTQNVAGGRVGWALAGDWTPDADPVTGTLADPCAMRKLDRADWVFRLQLTASSPGLSTVSLRRETDPLPFALSFADICGNPAFTQSNGGVDEVGNLVVMVAASCDDVVFFDNFERRDTSAWNQAVGL